MMRTHALEPAVTDTGRLGGLYRQHAAAAVRLAFLLTGDRALAEDLVQEAFVRLAGRFRDLRNPDAFEWYLRRTVVNLARSHFRHARVERRYAEEQRGAVAGEVEAPTDMGEREALWQALLALPERQRTAIVLRYYEDLSEAQTADAMQCPVGTVKSLVSRGMDRLRELVTRE
ncbi:MAG: SigE family RNA polymerase sigma factor [Actinomycetota bacterium]|nr:SigE family RNA polymerase sigma factor [Actinomycetota bacterium]